MVPGQRNLLGTRLLRICDFHLARWRLRAARRLCVHEHFTVTPSAAFAALGLAPGASPADVRIAYLRLSRRLHPDAGGEVAAFVDLKTAFDVAMDYARKEPCGVCGGVGTVALSSSAWG